MRIAIDAMGGDYAPDEIIKGAIAAAYELKDKIESITLVGKEEIISEKLKEYKYEKSNNVELFLQNAETVIDMHESATVALRNKKDASIVVAARLLRDGYCDALLSAGNTGATMATALIALGRLPHVKRPAIAITIPTLDTPTLLLDGGANVDCKPQHLLQFAQIGSAYAKSIFNIEHPKVGLLSIGEEETKGNELTIQATKLLKNCKNINFIGNVEGRDIINKKADVVVCDGFVGNIVLKFGEGLAEMLYKLLKDEFSSNIVSKIGAYLTRMALDKIKKLTDYAEYGGAPLLGVNGTCIISHGASTAKAIKNAIKLAYKMFNSDVNERIAETLK